ncbi:MAG: hypothetical protein QUU85_14640, partial [Candidatus Eisenbacteria bacterium]|nr:hypothetical protein [Candidatus Eisenbacteria bacterium]
METGPGFARLLLRTGAAGPVIVPAEEGQLRLVLDGFLEEPDPSGEITIPARTFFVGIPPSGGATVTFETRDRVDLPAVDANGQPIPASRLPERSIEWGAPSWMRGQRVVPVVWHPVVRRASGGGAALEREISVTVRFDDPGDRG